MDTLYHTVLKRDWSMNKKEYDLLEEPWIQVIGPSLEPRGVSLTDVLIHAHEYIDLSGETPTQDAAIFRVLLAAALTIFYRYDENGEEMEISEDNDMDSEDVLERWQAYWERGRFPEQAVRRYLDMYHERFWLFHPETPFWQVNDLQYGTDYTIGCLLGNMKESNNVATRHHFSMGDGEGAYRLDYAQAARWLIHLNAYAVNIKADKKAPGTKLPVGVGRLGQLGLVMVGGDDLFKMLMLNLCPLDGEELWEAPKPAWEKKVRVDQGYETSCADNLPELYTIQSRRIMLKRDAQGDITGFRALGGDFYPVEDDFSEPMTLWHEKTGKKKGDPTVYLPKKHDPAVHVWREFPTLFNGKDGARIPGVLKWIKILYEEKILTSASMVTFRMVGIVYGDKMNYTYGDCVNDTLRLSAGFLDDLGSEWIVSITEQIDKCQSVAAGALDHFSNKIVKLFYGSGTAKNNIKRSLTSQYFFSIDHAFREWLACIDTEKDSREEKMIEWEKRSYRAAKRTVEDYVATLNKDLYTSRMVDKEWLTVPKILQEYIRGLNKIYHFPGQKDDGRGGASR